MSVYRNSIEHLRLGPLRGLTRCDLLNLGRINVLCGKNNTGKSTLLEAASLKETAALGLTPDDEFIEALVKTNNAAVDNFFSRGGHTRVPYGNLRKDLPSLFRQATSSRPAWFATEGKELVETISKMVASPEMSNLRNLIHSSSLVEDIERSF
jgi:recombinational DNA repair ATPase RecF